MLPCWHKQIDDIIEAVDELEDLADVGELMKILSPPRKSARQHIRKGVVKSQQD